MVEDVVVVVVDPREVVRAEVVVVDALLVVLDRLKVTRLLLQIVFSELRGQVDSGLDLLSMSMGFTSATFFHFSSITAFAIDVGQKSSIESVFRGEGDLLIG